jgi:hypothetical protein
MIWVDELGQCVGLLRGHPQAAFGKANALGAALARYRLKTVMIGIKLILEVS